MQGSGPGTALHPDAVRLNREAVQALANRRMAEARQLLGQALSLEPRLIPAWMNLAAAKRMEGDLGGAMEAVASALEIEPLNFAALLMRGSLYEAMGLPRQAAQAYLNALPQTPAESDLDPASRRAVTHAIEFSAAHRREMEAHLRHDLAAEKLSGNSAEIRRMSGFLDQLLGKRRVYRSDPINFCYPGLPSIEFYDREEFPWLADLEAATPQIRAELIGVFEDEAASKAIEPYAQHPEKEAAGQWAELNWSMNWSAYHFANHGEIFEERRRKCPVTAGLLDLMPQPHLKDRSPAALFSILRPKTHIPPHRGVANFRLICHMPLILPPDCRLRVGNITREWRMGEAFVFDDTIEHEAWNDSDQIRTVLIFDIWHPQLGAEERDFISRSIESLDRFNA